MNAETLKELLANVTPGPWSYSQCSCGHPSCNQQIMDNQGSVGFSEPDARLIALAPQLAADNIALQAEVERLRGALEQLIAGYEVWDFDPSTQKLVRLPDEKQTSWIRQARAALDETPSMIN